MNAWINQTKLELILLLRMRWPLLLPLAAGVLIGFQLDALASGSSGLRLRLIETMGTFHTLSLALPMLLGVLLVRRDLLHPAYEWMHALPVNNSAYLLGKAFAGFLYLMLIPAATGIAYAIAYLQAGLPAADLLGSYMPFLLHQSGSYAVTLVLGMTIGVLVPGRFALPIAFCGWLFGSVFLQEFIVVQLGWYPLKPFFLHHFLNASFMMNEGWSGALQQEYVSFLPFVLLFTVFMLAWSAAAVGRTRPEGSPHRQLIVTLVALVASAAAYWPYADMWTDRYAHLRMLAQAAPVEEDAKPHAPYAFAINAARAEVTKQSEHGIRVSAAFEVPLLGNRPIAMLDTLASPWEHAPGSLTFLLHPSMRVSEARLDGVPVPVARDGDRLSVPLGQIADRKAASTAHVEIQYSGSLDEWAYGPSGESLWAFIREGGVYLPGHIGWFPIPGGDSLFYRSASTLHDRADAAYRSAPADYELTLRGFGSLPFYTSLPRAARAPEEGDNVFRFAGSDTAIPSLYGGSFIEVGRSDEGPIIVTTPANRSDSELYLQELNRRIAYYDAWLGKDGNDGGLGHIFYLPNHGTNSYWYGTSEYSAGNAMFLTQYTHASLGADELQAAMRRYLYGDNDFGLYSDLAEGSPSIVGEIRQAIWMMYELEHGQVSERWMTPPYVAVSPDGIPIMEHIAGMLREAVADGRTAQARDALASFYRKGLSIQATYFGYAGGGSTPTPSATYPVITYEDWLQAWQQFDTGNQKEASNSD